AEIIEAARENARLDTDYVALMVVAGVIAAFGVIQRSHMLIVGAMAVSPDLLPISAACIGLVCRRPRLTVRATRALLLGLRGAALVAAVVTATLDRTGILPADFRVADASLGSLTTVDAGTFAIALAAGVAGLLSIETGAMSAVGVAISVTTIPAAAYAGV